MKLKLIIWLIALLGLSPLSFGNSPIEYPEYAINQDSVEISINPAHDIFETEDSFVIISKESGQQFKFKNSDDQIKIPLNDDGEYTFRSGDYNEEIDIRVLNPWLSILPPLVAILLALIFKEVIISLFAGIFIGALAIHGLSFSGLFGALFSAIDHYFLEALTDSGNLSVVIFSTGIGGMVSVISRNGGMQGVVDKLSVFAKSVRSSQLVTWALGLAIFFDDYANTLIVGNTMRPVLDKYKVSREKLAYIVDSTAAPIAALAFITTWIGAELAYISKATSELNIQEGAYSMFLNSLAYAFYPILTIVFMFILLWRQVDFGPMLKFERLARKGEKNGNSSEVNSNEGMNAFTPINPDASKWYNGFLPVLTVILVTIIGLVITGTSSLRDELVSEALIEASNSGFFAVWKNLSALSAEPINFFQKIAMIIGASDSYVALLWASFAGIVMALALTVSQKIMSITQSIETMIGGFKTMLPAMLILTMAWSLSIVTEELGTAVFLTSMLRGNIAPELIPAITFVLAALIAFSTGSSWGTMAILYPLAIPASWVLCQEAGITGPESMSILYHTISVVLAGSVLGDHCSPISDTTIMSSLASECNHVNHVKTQLPYALTVGLVSLLMSSLVHYLPTHWTINVLIGVVILFLIVKQIGRKAEPAFNS